MKRYELDVFTKRERISEILEEIDKINREINLCKSATKIDDYHRALAYLMCQLRQKEYKILGWKRSYNLTTIYKKFGFTKKDDFLGGEWSSSDVDCFMDHMSKEIRVYDNGKQEVIVSEPYNLSMERCKKMIKFCEDNNLTFNIDGQSIHFPDNTFRISFMEKEKEERAIQSLKKMWTRN